MLWELAGQSISNRQAFYDVGLRSVGAITEADTVVVDYAYWAPRLDISFPCHTDGAREASSVFPQEGVNNANITADSTRSDMQSRPRLPGESPVSSIENPTDQREEIMARWYDHVRMTVLREFVWNFAQNYTVLTRSGDGLGGHTDKYNLPNDCVRVNSVGSDPYNGIREYDIFGRKFIAVKGRASYLVQQECG